MFKSFDKLGVENRKGVRITPVNSTLKVEILSSYSNDKEFVYHIKETSDFNSNTDWEKLWNESTKYYQALMYQLEGGGIVPISKEEII